MALKITDTIRGPARGTADEALSHIDRPDENDGIFTRTIYANAPKVALDPAIVMAQVHLESAGLTSPRYRNDKNPSGLGIPADDTPQPFVIPNYEVAALMHLSALNRLVDGTKPEPWTLPANVEAWLSTVWKRHCNQAPPVRTIDDLNLRYQADGDSQATWAWDAEYQDGIVERSRLLFPSLPNQSTEETPPMALAIRQSMIPASNANRPETKLNNAPLLVTVHETANTSPGANAEMHRKFTHGGGGTEGVSFHFVVDDHEAIQLLPCDEVGFHAGDGCNDRATDFGCFQSVAIETCVNSDGDWNKTFDNLSTLIAAIINGDARIDFAGRRGQFSADRIRKHQDWSGKTCPATILARGLWPTLLANVRTKVGGTSPTVPPTVPPSPPPSPIDYPEGLDNALATDWFGSVKSGTATYKFDETGPVSQLWLTLGRYPKLSKVEQFDDRRYFRFSDGTVIWTPNAQAKPRVLK